MTQEEMGSAPTIEVGDKVWWQRGEGVRGMYDLVAGYSIPGTPGMQRTVRVGSSVLCGTVRAIGCEGDDFHYAVVAVAPDGRLLQSPLDHLSKGTPPMPPTRIQQQRVPGWRKPEGAIKVSRRKVKGFEDQEAPVGTPNYWGNPYPVEEYGSDQAIALYRKDVAALSPDYQRQWLEPLRHAKFLMCWCSVDEACHADVLIEFLANSP